MEAIDRGEDLLGRDNIVVLSGSHLGEIKLNSTYLEGGFTESLHFI